MDDEDDEDDNDEIAYTERNDNDNDHLFFGINNGPNVNVKESGLENHDIPTIDVIGCNSTSNCNNIMDNNNGDEQNGNDNNNYKWNEMKDNNGDSEIEVSYCDNWEDAFMTDDFDLQFENNNNNNNNNSSSHSNGNNINDNINDNTNNNVKINNVIITPNIEIEASPSIETIILPKNETSTTNSDKTNGNTIEICTSLKKILCKSECEHVSLIFNNENKYIIPMANILYIIENLFDIVTIPYLKHLKLNIYETRRIVNKETMAVETRGECFRESIAVNILDSLLSLIEHVSSFEFECFGITREIYSLLAEHMNRFKKADLLGHGKRNRNRNQNSKGDDNDNNDSNNKNDYNSTIDCKIKRNNTIIAKTKNIIGGESAKWRSKCVNCSCHHCYTTRKRLPLKLPKAGNTRRSTIAGPVLDITASQMQTFQTHDDLFLNLFM